MVETVESSRRLVSITRTRQDWKTILSDKLKGFVSRLKDFGFDSNEKSSFGTRKGLKRKTLDVLFKLVFPQSEADIFFRIAISFRLLRTMGVGFFWPCLLLLIFIINVHSIKESFIDFYFPNNTENKLRNFEKLDLFSQKIWETTFKNRYRQNAINFVNRFLARNNRFRFLRLVRFDLGENLPLRISNFQIERKEEKDTLIRIGVSVHTNPKIEFALASHSSFLVFVKHFQMTLAVQSRMQQKFDVENFFEDLKRRISLSISECDFDLKLTGNLSFLNYPIFRRLTMPMALSLLQANQLSFDISDFRQPSDFEIKTKNSVGLLKMTAIRSVNLRRKRVFPLKTLVRVTLIRTSSGGETFESRNVATSEWNFESLFLVTDDDRKSGKVVVDIVEGRKNKILETADISVEDLIQNAENGNEIDIPLVRMDAAVKKAQNIDELEIRASNERKSQTDRNCKVILKAAYQNVDENPFRDDDIDTGGVLILHVPALSIVSTRRYFLEITMSGNPKFKKVIKNPYSSRSNTETFLLPFANVDTDYLLLRLIEIKPEKTFTEQLRVVPDTVERLRRTPARKFRNYLSDHETSVVDLIPHTLQSIDDNCRWIASKQFKISDLVELENKLTVDFTGQDLDDLSNITFAFQIIKTS